MESLTTNLKEKEDNINHLNEMIDSYEKIINEQDNIIEIKNQRIKLLENILIKHNVSFPKDSIIQTNSYNNTKTNNLNSINNKEEYFNSDINQNLNITEEERIKSLTNNYDINDSDLNIDLNSNEKIKIKFSNSSMDNGSRKEKDEKNKKIDNNYKLKKEKNIEKEKINNNDNGKKKNIINKMINSNENLYSKSKKNFEIINNSLINHNNIGEISLESIEKYKDYDDDENFNVVISGTLKPKNYIKKDIIDKIEYKSSKNLSPFSSSMHSETEKSKISKLDSNNNLFSIESKDKISFIVNNIEKKKKIQIIKTPNISPKSRSRTKLQSNKSNKYSINFKKKK